TVVGIGDMAGDVFGNGMLQSEHICLVAAFNHLHIFVDPNPDAAASFKERKRLFELPRSAWSDYEKALISKGGGVFERSAKSISVSLEMKQRFGISADRLAPNDLINAILKAPVDLIWNGGIGTYVKSSSERNSQVGDKANDGLRVNGSDLRAKVVGEGGNLGMTQLGRIEYAVSGGASYTDFIDNAGGVDCSDHEVNIKILLKEVLDKGDLTQKQRNKTFMDLTDDVAQLVLSNNYRQTQAIALAYKDCVPRLEEYSRFIKSYETQGKLNRALEFLPDDETLNDRKASGGGLTRPELAVLICYTKADLKEAFNCPDIHQDDYIGNMLSTAFPDALAERFAEPMQNHKLRQEIIATQLANDMVNYMGITFTHRLHKSTGASASDIARAYMAARDIFQLEDYWQQICALDYQIGTDAQEDMMTDLMRLVRRATRWFLRNRRAAINIAGEVEKFRDAVAQLAGNLGSTLRGAALQRWQSASEERQKQGIPEALASYTAGASNLYSALGIIEAASQIEREVDEVAEAYFEVGEQLSLNWFGQQINNMETNSHWEALVRESLRDDLDWQQRAVTAGVLNAQNEGESLSDSLLRWEKEQQRLVDRWQSMLGEMQTADRLEFAMVAVAMRELLDLAQASRNVECS
ncbi:MAG: NAD-glutamate dehydrogenase domain-containing protein, partial [Oceanobacter sp.]